ncbi:MAG: hypothetical protein ACP5M0_15890 [Desulfomonilaceae bacterium]
MFVHRSAKPPHIHCRTIGGVAVMGVTIALFLISGICDSALFADDQCQTMQKELLQKKTELSELIDALNKSYAQGDYTLMDVLNFKINQLINQTKELERKLEGCPQPPTPVTPPGMSGMKTDEDILAEKGCGELKKMLLPLARKVHALKRREQSVLSGLTAEEKSELAKAEAELKTLKEILAKKCDTKPAPESLKKRLRR